MTSLPSFYDPVSGEGATWLVDSLGEIGNAQSRITLRGILPTGYPSYARIFHPAWLEVTQETEGSTRLAEGAWVVPVTWSQVAEYNGCLMAGQAQWKGICGGRSGLPVPAEQPVGQNWTYPPDEGVLTPGSVAERVFDLLGQEAEPETECFCAFWDGYGGIQETFPEAACFRTRHDEYRLCHVQFSALRHYYSTRSTANPSLTL